METVSGKELLERLGIENQKITTTGSSSDFDLESILDRILQVNELECGNDFESSVRPLMKYLGKNHNQHTQVIVENNMAELVEGCKTFLTDEYITD